MLGPALFGVVDGLGVDGDRAGPVLVGCADPDLDDGGGVLGEDEGLGEGEFVDAVAADLVAGADGEFQEAGGGEGCHAADGVVHQPGVGLAERRPVNRTPSVPARETAAPSSGCSAETRPAALTSPAAAMSTGQ